MRLNYPGNILGVVGRVMGPDMHGAWYEAVSASYSPETDKTAVKFRPVPPNDQRLAQQDEFGELRVREVTS